MIDISVSKNNRSATHQADAFDMTLVDGKRYFSWFYAITFFIPVGVVALGLFFPHALGLQNLGEFFQKAFETAEANNITVRGSALLPGILISIKYPTFWLMSVATGAPTIAAIIVSAFYFGRQGLKSLVSRLKPWRNGVTATDGLKWWAALIVFFVVANLVSFTIAAALGLSPQFVWGVDILSLTFVWFFISAMFLDMGGLLEETGWHGFAAPILQSRMSSPLKAALFLGLLWAIWHLPREVVSFSTWSELLISQAGFFISAISLMIIITFFFNKLGGSTLAAIAAHGLANDSVGLGGVAYDPDPVSRALIVVVPYLIGAVAVVLLSGSTLGLRPEDKLNTSNKSR